MSSDDRTSAQLDRDLRQLFISQADVVTPRPHVMTEIALRDSARRRHRRELRLVGAGLATAATVVAALLIGSFGLDRSDDSLPAVPRPTVTGDVPLREPATGEVVETVQLPGGDASAAFAALGHVFVRLRSPVTIAKVDPATNGVVDSVRLPEAARLTEGIDPVLAAGSLWWSGKGAVYRLDPRSMTVTDTVRVDSRWAAVASDGRRVWVAEGHGVTEIDTTHSSLAGHITMGAEPADLAFTAGSLWAITGTTLLQLDPDTAAVVGRTSLPGKLDVLGMLAVDDSLWVAVMGQDRLVRITSRGEVAASVLMPSGSLAFDEFDPQLGSSSDGRTVWSMTAGSELVAVDVETARVVDRIHVTESIYHSQVAVVGDTVWVPVRSTSTVRLFQWRDR